VTTGADPRDRAAPRRKRSRDATMEALEKALLRLKNLQREISITAVANEVGVSPGLIHNTYPAMASKIRTAAGRSSKAKKDAAVSKLDEARAQIKSLRSDLKTALSDLANLASVNARLMSENESLQASLGSKVRHLSRLHIPGGK